MSEKEREIISERDDATGRWQMSTTEAQEDGTCHEGRAPYNDVF